MRALGGCLLACLLLFSATAFADDGSEVAEAQSRLKTAQTVKALGTDLFGDSTNFLDGKTSFTTTDIDLPGNNGLPVRLTRIYVATDPHFDNSVGAGAWEFEVPFVSGIFPTGYNWKGTGSSPYNRCTGMGALPTVSGFTPWIWQRANFIHVPGIGDQSMTSNLTVSDGQSNIPVTSKYWKLSCGVQLANAGSNDFAGEGFVYTSSDGTKYTFNWMTSRVVQPVKRVTPPAQGQTQNGSIALVRNEIRLLATRVEDRFGNYVTYTYSGTQLTQISASDGRTITLNYNGSNQLTSAVAAGKTWQYSLGSTSTVTLPDGTSWQYTFPRLFDITYGFPPQYLAATCNKPASWNPSTQTQTVHIVHPSGAVGDFTFLLTRHGRTYVNNTCDVDEGGNPYGNKLYLPPEFTDNFALSQKQISGPGLTTQIWSVAYAAAAGSTLNDNTGPDTTAVTVTNPDSSKTAYTFGIHYQYNDGKLLETQTLNPSGTVVRDVVSTFALNPSNPPYTYDIGTPGDNFAERFVTPLTQSKITQDGTTYTSTVNGFDNMARVISTTRSGPSGSRTDTTGYYDNTSKWVFGQIQSQTNTDTNTVVSSTTFDPITVKPSATYAYGLLQRSVTYNADGTVATVANGLSQTVTLTNWKRGVPQNIKFPDNSTQSAVIDDSGLVTSATDELSNTTNYSYDGVGHLVSLIWPTGDTVNWAAKAVTYSVLSSSELGVPAGSWRMRLVEGNHQKSVYYDARLNPVLEEEKDTALNLVRYVRHGYDTMGRVIFESYPSTSYSVTAGINKTYDYLDRATQTRTTDGTILSTTAYLSGNQLQVKDSAGNVTTTSYQAFDKPGFDKPLMITAPQSQTTTYSRNVLGETLSAIRSGGSSSVTEINVYDINHRLCKVIRPESGRHIIGFDAASQMSWSASGTDVGTTSTSNCDYGLVTAAQQTTFGYDSRGRKKQINYPDSSGNVALGYDAAGHLTSVNNPTANWAYSYNKRGLVELETLSIDGGSFIMDPSYDVLAHVATETYPDGTNVVYAPDAWGEDTQVGGYASSIARQPNGIIQSAHFGNGLNYASTLDSRLRIASQTVTGSSTLQSLSYSYNNDSLITGVTDNVDGTDTASFGYDGLHRITTGNGLWGNYTYGYDALGNITSRGGANALTYNYDGTNRLSSVSGGVSRNYGYDTKGRIASDGRYGFSWNQADQITGEPNVAAYSYDGNGKRVKVTLANGSSEIAFYDPSGKLRYTSKSGTATDYLDLDGKAFVELGPAYSGPTGGTSGSSTGTTTGTTTGGGTGGTTGGSTGGTTTGRLGGGGGCGTGTTTGGTIGCNAIPVNKGGNGTYAAAVSTALVATYLHTDWLGSPKLATDSSGNVVWREHFDPYGKKLNGVTEKRGYTGHSYDQETGNTYMLARYYDADVGRFLMTDPIGSKDDFNLYAYTGGNPTNGTDPTGTSNFDAEEAASSAAALNSIAPVTVSPGAMFGGGATQNQANANVPVMIPGGVRSSGSASNSLAATPDNSPPMMSAQSREVKPKDFGFHVYARAVTNNGTPEDAFDVGRSYTAPGAPYAQDGTHSVLLSGGNPIRQTVDPVQLSILNETEPGHIFGGTVRMMFGTVNGRSTEIIFGIGFGNNTTLNEILGPALFYRYGVSVRSRFESTSTGAQ